MPIGAPLRSHCGTAESDSPMQLPTCANRLYFHGDAGCDASAWAVERPKAFATRARAPATALRDGGPRTGCGPPAK